MNFVRFLVILGAASTFSTLHPSRNCEYGLFKECLWFFEASTIFRITALLRKHQPLTDFGKVLDVPAILLKVLLCPIIKHAGGTRAVVLAQLRLELLRTLINERGGRRSIGKVGSEAAWFHALEAQRQSALNLSVFDGVIDLVERGRTGRAVVVYVDDGNAGQAEVVERPLRAACQLALDGPPRPVYMCAMHTCPLVESP